MLYDPGGTCTVLAYRPAHYCLRPKVEYRLPLVVLSRLNRFTLSHYGSRTPLSTLHAGLTASHARLSTGCLLSFAGSGLSPDYTIHAELAHTLCPLNLLNPRARGAMSLILDIHGDPWYHISNFKEGNDKKSRASQMAKRAACGESSAGGPPEDGLGASGPNGQARRDCPLQQQGIYGIVRRTCQVLFR